MKPTEESLRLALATAKEYRSPINHDRRFQLGCDINALVGWIERRGPRYIMTWPSEVCDAAGLSASDSRRPQKRR